MRYFNGLLTYWANMLNKKNNDVLKIGLKSYF